MITSIFKNNLINTNLNKLLKPWIHNAPLHNISGLTTDSRTVNINNLFIAVYGHNTKGHKYISQAISNGASVILVEVKKK